MTHFPVDAPKGKVIKAFELLGFSLVRERETLDTRKHLGCFLSTPHHMCILSSIGAHTYTRGVDHRQEHLFTAFMVLCAVIA